MAVYNLIVCSNGNLDLITIDADFLLMIDNQEKQKTEEIKIEVAYDTETAKAEKKYPYDKYTYFAQMDKPRLRAVAQMENINVEGLETKNELLNKINYVLEQRKGG